MRGRRSSRSAAVVLAGCVGLAVMAPGLALAAPVPDAPGEAACASALGTWDETARTCTPASSGVGSRATRSPSTDGGLGGSSTADAPVRSSAPTPSTSTPAPSTDGPEATSPTVASTAAEPDDEATAAPAGVAPGEDAQQETEDARSELQAVVEEATGADSVVTAALPQDALAALAEAFGRAIPTAVPTEGFTNPQDSCAYLASQLQVPADVDALGLAGQLGGFCASLPENFLDPDALTGLIGDLLDLLTGLIPSLPTPGTGPGTIPDEAPHHVPAHYKPYWHKKYDVDCPELTYEEANAILAWDRSDPFRLDRDKDGEACEANARHHGGEDVEYVEYRGYPVGGVATGDGSTGSGAAGVEVALAAGVLSGLGVTGLVLVRRFARQG